MMKKDEMRKEIRLIRAVAFSIFCMIFYYASHPLYRDVDNYLMSIVTNRMFDTDNYCIFMNPFLNQLIGRISDLIPTADAFALLCNVVWLIAMISLSFWAARDWKDDLCILGLSQIMGVWNANFTVQAAGFTFVGLILLRRRTAGLFQVLAGSLLAGMGLLLRIQAGMLFIPFLLLELTISLIRERKNVLPDLKRYALLFLIFCVVFGTRHYYRSSEIYGDSVVYNNYRVKMEDYPVRSWDEIEDQAEGVSEYDYLAAVNWILLDTERMNQDTLKELAEKASTFVDIKEEWKQIPEEMRKTFMEGGIELWILLVCTLWLIVQGIAFGEDKWEKWKSLAIFAGGMLIILAFTVIGRAPVRIWEAVIFAQLYTTLDVSGNNPVKDPKCWCFVPAGVLIFGIVFCTPPTQLKVSQIGLTARENANDSCFEETYHEDTICIRDDWHELLEETFMKQGKLPSERFLEHNIAVGDWTYGQVYYQHYLEKLGIPNPAKALIEREDVYYVGDQEELLYEYLKQ